MAAAWAAGAFDLPDAVRLIYVRSRNQEKIKGRGTMAAALAVNAIVDKLDTYGGNYD